MSESGKKSGALFSACALYLLAAVGLWLVSLLGGGLFLCGTQEQRTLLVNLVYYLPFMFAPAVMFMANQKDDPVARFRLNPVTLGDTLRLTLIAIVVLLIAQNLSMVWMALWEALGVDVADTTYVRPANTSELTLSILSTALVAPVCEELLFRGVILSEWDARGERKALFVSTVLFALLHGNWLGLPAELFGGMMLGILVLTSDSFYAGLICHSVYNAAIVMLNYAATDPALPQEDVSASMLSLIGGVGGAVLMVLRTFFLLIVLFLLMWKYFHRYTVKNMCPEENPDGSLGMLVRPHTLFGNPRKYEPLSAGTILLLMAGIVSGVGMMILNLIPRIGG